MHARELRLACGESYIELSVSGLRVVSGCSRLSTTHSSTHGANAATATWKSCPCLRQVASGVFSALS